MLSRLSLSGLAVTLTLLAAAPAWAQFDPDFPKKPQSTAEYWRALQFSIAQGKYDVAAEYLKGLLAGNPTEKDLITIEEAEGIAKFLNLRNIPRWSDDQKINAEAKSNVEDLIQRVSTAVKKFRADPDRIQKYLANLSATLEEREYAIRELKKSGSAVMPYLVSALSAADVTERGKVLSILPLLNPETVPPLLASFDIPNPALRAEFLDVIASRPDLLQLLQRTETDARPTLWYMTTQPEPVGRKARAMLQAILGVTPANLPKPAIELTKAAEQIYQHKSSFAKEAVAPTLWVYETKQLTAPRMTVTQAEEYLGLRYARWAMEVDPTYVPARVLFLSIAVEKALERGGLEGRLAKTAPAVHQLLATASGATLYAILEKALAENHLTVAYGVAQVIGERAEATGAKGAPAAPGSSRKVDGVRGEPAGLVSALHSKDRRVALAAADALIRLPGTPQHQVMSRVVEVYRSALAMAAGGEAAAVRPKALIGDADAVRAGIFSDLLRQAGFDTVVTRTGRDTLKRLSEAADIDVLYIDNELAYPELPELLAQLRADFRYGRRPLFVTLSEDISKALLPEMDVRIEKLTNIIPLVQVREKSPIRVTFTFDALKIDAEDLEGWLREMKRDFPRVRSERRSELRVILALEKIKEQPPELAQQIKDLTLGLLEITVNQESKTRYTFIMDGSKPPPSEFQTKLERLQRDYSALVVTRELPTILTMTSSFSTEIPREVFSKVNRQVEGYTNARVIRRPLTIEGVREELAYFQDPATRPLSATERGEQQLRAIEALQRLATGAVPGYDVRPASVEIRAAMRIDTLAPAAIEATGRLPGKEAQQDLAEYVLAVRRPAALRVRAARELLRHIEAHTASPLTDAQIQRLLVLFAEEKNADVKATIALIAGAIPHARVWKNLPDDAARQAWQNRLLQYRPPAGAPAPPAPAPKAGG